MIKKEILIILLIFIVFLSGCIKVKETEKVPSDEQIIDYNQDETENQDLEDLSEDISNVENLDNDLDDDDLTNLEQDLENIDW
jgi:PBP1b-binding outer membrane lipoprotein LpoB